MNFEDIPGYAEARRLETQTRAEAFLDVPRTLCGLTVAPLTLHRLGVLTAAHNSFLCGGDPSLEAVAVFLWVVSPEFNPGSLVARDLFVASLRTAPALADLAECSEQIAAFLREMFLDAPFGRRGKSGVAVTSGEAIYCDMFASEYGWSEEKTLHTPLPRLWQLVRRITLRHDPKALFVNPSDKIRGEYFRAQDTAVSSTVEQAK